MQPLVRFIIMTDSHNLTQNTNNTVSWPNQNIKGTNRVGTIGTNRVGTIGTGTIIYLLGHIIVSSAVLCCLGLI